MALQVTSTGRNDTVGDGVQLAESAQTVNTNAPPAGAAQLQAGANTIQVPSGFTVQSATLYAPTGSANSKTVKGIAGDAGLGPWTSDWIKVPVTAGGTFVIQSAGPEMIKIVWG